MFYMIEASSKVIAMKLLFSSTVIFIKLWNMKDYKNRKCPHSSRIDAHRVLVHNEDVSYCKPCFN